jgi:hypothetical protein
MNPKIKAVIATISKPGRLRAGVEFDLSAAEQTPLGHILRRMYFYTDITDLFRGSITGYPHNGGRHTCHFSGSKEDALVFLELLQEELRTWFCPKKDLVEHCILNELTFVAQELHARTK